MPSNKKGKATGIISFGQHLFNVSLDLIIFKEDDTSIVYCPPLEIYGYGTDENEARESFRISFEEFFRYCTNKNTLRTELKRLGWQMKRSKSKPMIPPPNTELLATSKTLVAFK